MHKTITAAALTLCALVGCGGGSGTTAKDAEVVDAPGDGALLDATPADATPVDASAPDAVMPDATPDASAPALLGIAPASSSFPDTVVGATSATITLTLTNTGATASGVIGLTKGGTAPAAFSVVTAADQCTGQTLTPGASCSFGVSFAPTSAGLTSASVTASASPGGSAVATLTGKGLSARLTGSVASYDFGVTPVARTGNMIWTVTNSGDAPSGAVSVSKAGANASEFTHTTTCGGTLGPGGSCTVSITFAPTSLGAKSATFTALATPGGMVTVMVTGSGAYRLTVQPAGTGGVSSTDGKILNCGLAAGVCSADYTAVTSVTLQARTSNGSHAYFQGWSGNTTCSGPARDCVDTVDQQRDIVATFGSYATAGNLMFYTSSTSYPSNLGGNEATYDRICNDVASAAGINNSDAPNGSSYLAWLSTATPTTGNARARLGTTARGFIRMDGKLIADDQTSMFSATSPRIFNSPYYDETGHPAGSDYVWTGTLYTGATGNTCTNWTGTGTAVTAGHSNGGAPSWTEWAFNANACSGTTAHLLCVMNVNSTAIAPPAAPAGAKKMVVSTNNLTVGSMTPDARCQADAGPTYKALIARQATPASAILGPTTTYMRPDGTVIGTGAEIAANAWRSGVWQTSDGSYLTSAPLVFTGSRSPGATGTLASTCNDWTDSATPGGGANIGEPTWVGVNTWAYAGNLCVVPNRILCVEQ